MIKAITSYYDALYRKVGNDPLFPDTAVVEAAKRFRGCNHSVKVLDIGCGRGRNSLYLATFKGFQVKAIDVSQTALNSVKGHAREIGLALETQCCDILNRFDGRDYNIMVGTYLFDHFDQEHAHQLIRRMQQKTRPRGTHAIVAFAEGAELGMDFSYPRHLFNQKELLGLYYGWRILYCKQFIQPKIGPVLHLTVEKQ